MKVVDGEVEIDGDDALRRAQLVKVTVQTLAVALTCVIYAHVLINDDVKHHWKYMILKWRTAFFGPPPLTEEQVQEAERQTIVEALRIVRSGDES